MKRQALGRGLSALLSEEYREARDVVTEVEVDALAPGKRQPRTAFDEGALADLARSIKENGIIQPIVLRREGNRLEIVAGERRWRAAKSLGLKRIPALIRDLAPQKSLEIALVENLQRQDLNPMEEARAYDWLIQDYGLSQEEVAKRVGKDRSTVTNVLRLLKLPEDIQQRVAGGQLAMGHARAILGMASVEEMRALAERVLAEGLSVRQVEELARTPAPPAKGSRAKAATAKAQKDVHDRAAERRMEQRLGTRVVIRRSGRGGRIEIAFYSDEELQGLFEALMGDDDRRTSAEGR